MPARKHISTLADMLDQSADTNPNGTSFTYLDTLGNEVHRDTFAELRERAHALARRLIAEGLSGERVLLLARAPQDFVPAFFACMYAGSVAVPMKLPARRQELPRLQRIIRECDPRAVITDADPWHTLIAKADNQDMFHGMRIIPWDGGITANTLPHRSAGLDGDCVAFLQYTSGSTASSRPVMLSHNNLLHNLRMIDASFLCPERSWVSWLPPYHDMGLIGLTLSPVYSATSSVMMPSAAFSQRPVLWLEVLSRYGASVSGGPSFAFQACTRTATDAEIAQLDLSRWRIAFMGAEPIRADIVHQFAERFAAAGFRREALFPCYGLAEATLFVAGSQVGGGAETLRVEHERLLYNEAVAAPEPPALHIDPHADANAEPNANYETRAPAAITVANDEVAPAAKETTILTSSGRPTAESELRIVDPTRHNALPDGRVGEIWLRNGSVAQGYWHCPDDSRHVFDGYIAGDSGQKSARYLRTGDLGFLLDGKLYVIGRLKDLITIDGRNYQAPAVEEVVRRAHHVFDAQLSAAFAVEAGDEQAAVVVIEVSRSTWHRVRKGKDNGQFAMELLRHADAALTADLGLSLAELVIVPPSGIPRTTSGKVRRQEVKRRYLARELSGAQALSNIRDVASTAA